MTRREQERERAERMRAMLEQTNARRAGRLRAMAQQVAQLLADGQIADPGAWEQAHQLLKDATAIALQGSVMAHNNRIMAHNNRKGGV